MEKDHEKEFNKTKQQQMTKLEKCIQKKKDKLTTPTTNKKWVCNLSQHKL